MSWWVLAFSRWGPARYLSHLDTTRALQRTFSRAGIELALSQGMRPKAQISLPLPLPVGAAGVKEVAVVESVGDLSEAALAQLRAAAPPGISPLALASSGERHPHPQPQAAHYTCLIDGEAQSMAAAVQRFRDEDHVVRERVSPKGRRLLDLKDYVVDVGSEPRAEGAALSFVIRYRASGAARPQEYVDLVAEWAGVEPVMRDLERVRITWKDLPRG